MFKSSIQGDSLGIQALLFTFYSDNFIFTTLVSRLPRCMFLDTICDHSVQDADFFSSSIKCIDNAQRE